MSIERRLMRLEARVVGLAGEGGSLHLLRMIASSQLELEPDLRLVVASDTDKTTYRRIRETLALADGDTRTYLRLNEVRRRAEGLPKPRPVTAISVRREMARLIREPLKAEECQEIVAKMNDISKATITKHAKEETAIAAARRRLAAGGSGIGRRTIRAGDRLRTATPSSNLARARGASERPPLCAG